MSYAPHSCSMSQGGCLGMGYDAYETSLKRPPQQPAGGPMVGCAMRQWVIASLLPCIVMVKMVWPHCKQAQVFNDNILYISVFIHTFLLSSFLFFQFFEIIKKNQFKKIFFFKLFHLLIISHFYRPLYTLSKSCFSSSTGTSGGIKTQ